MYRSLSTILLTALLLGACGPQQQADKVLINGTVVTVDEAQPEAEAIAIRGERIMAVGSDEEIQEYRGSGTEVIDLQGQLAIPGFIEGHGHFSGIGDAQLQLELLNLSSWQAVVDKVEEAAEDADPGELIRGRGWHQDDWDEAPQPNVGRLPHHDDLSAVSPDNPVVLTHASGHMSFANETAMDMAGIDADTPDPEGGEIVRDEQGNAIGAFRQNAQRVLGEVTRLWDPELSEQVEGATQEVLSKGVTSVQDAGSSIGTISEYVDMARRGELDVRLWVMARDSNENLAEHLGEYAHQVQGDPHLTVGGIKKAIDGAMGTHGAWLLDPYDDMPGSTGFNTTSLDIIREAGEIALQHDLQLAVHAIGDRGNRETMDIYQELFEEHQVMNEDLRWRIEHAQTIHPNDVPRFAEMGVIASMQAVHATSDGPWVYDRLGEERARERAYVWRSLLDEGVRIVNGTDAPVEDVDPLESFHASVTRDTGEGLFFPGQSMTRQEALRSYTLDAAYGTFESELKGSITPGKLADIVVLSENIMDVPEEQIRDAEVVYTLVGGNVKYERD